MPLISPGQLIDRAWEHFHTHLSELLSISGWIVITAILNVIALALYPDVTTLATGAALSGTEVFGTILFFASSAIITPIIGVWVLCAITRLVDGQAGSGARLSVQGAMREGWRLFWPAVFVSILLQLVMLGGLLIGFGPSIVVLLLGWILKNNTLYLLGNLLLAIGTIIATIVCVRWFVQFVFAPYALLLEGTRGQQALLRSRELTRGRFWSVLGRYALPKLFFVLVGVLLMAVVSFGLNIFVSGAAGLNVDVYLRLSSITNTVVPIVLTALLNPLLIISDVLLYNSLRGR